MDEGEVRQCYVCKKLGTFTKKCTFFGDYTTVRYNLESGDYVITGRRTEILCNDAACKSVWVDHLSYHSYMQYKYNMQRWHPDLFEIVCCINEEVPMEVIDIILDKL